MKPAALRLRAPVYGASGYAQAARHFALALAEQAPYPLRIEPLQWRSGFDVQEEAATRQKLQALEVQHPPRSDELLLHWSIASEFAGRQGCAQALGHCIFESNSLIQDFVRGCNRMDGVIVPTTFHQQAFAAAGVSVPMGIVPEGVDCERFNPDGPRLKQVPERFTFLFVAQLGYRKGFDLALRAFLELFAGHDDVQLLLRCYLKDGSPADLQEVANLIQLFRQQALGGEQRGHVYLLENVPDLHLPALYRSAHVLLAPFRGEGWGLPIVEALASTTPVIATHWGGPTAYLQPGLAQLLPYTLQPIPPDIPELFLGGHLLQARAEGHLLAEPDVQQLKYAMWAAYENYALYKLQAVQARQHLAAHFRWEQAAEAFIRWVEQL